jgi:hypothetical protein
MLLPGVILKYIIFKDEWGIHSMYNVAGKS